MVNFIEDSKRYSGGSELRLLLLDEVTSVKGWQRAIKYLWDHGDIDSAVVVCTGSSAADLKFDTAERLPGRRGAGQDHLALPKSFAEFAKALNPGLPSLPNLTLSDIASKSNQNIFKENRPYQPTLNRALEKYQIFGGLPISIAEVAGGFTAPSIEAKRVIYDSLLKALLRKQASEPAFTGIISSKAMLFGVEDKLVTICS
jgi:predicted AAA+ superfamily ATPase